MKNWTCLSPHRGVTLASDQRGGARPSLDDRPSPARFARQTHRFGAFAALR